jgi:F-type H+-transporting ATPase subunit gamma
VSALGETQGRIASIRKLKAVVGAMRGIAATHLQHARAALEGYRAFSDTIADGLANAMQLLPDDGVRGAHGTGATAVVAFTAEHGFAGGFSGRVLDQIEGGVGPLFLVGSRGAALAQQKGLDVHWAAPMASQASGVADTARHVADALYAAVLEGRIPRAEVVFSQAPASGVSTMIRRPLLPLDRQALHLRRKGQGPLTNLEPTRLVERLVAEYVFAELALAALESFASENAARLQTMEAARLNIDQKLDELSGQERLLRQEEITAEVQDVVAGALASEAAHDRRA